MSNQLYVCFLENDLSLMESHWLNRMAAKLAPPVIRSKPKIHVELFFPSKEQNSDENVSGEACSIYYNSKVFLTHKNFSRKQWSFRTLDVTPDQHKKVYNFCKAHVGDPFNHLTYFTYPLGCKQVHSQQGFIRRFIHLKQLRTLLYLELRNFLLLKKIVPYKSKIII